MCARLNYSYNSVQYLGNIQMIMVLNTWRKSSNLEGEEKRTVRIFVGDELLYPLLFDGSFSAAQIQKLQQQVCLAVKHWNEWI